MFQFNIAPLSNCISPFAPKPKKIKLEKGSSTTAKSSISSKICNTLYSSPPAQILNREKSPVLHLYTDPKRLNGKFSLKRKLDFGGEATPAFGKDVEDDVNLNSLKLSPTFQVHSSESYKDTLMRKITGSTPKKPVEAPYAITRNTSEVLPLPLNYDIECYKKILDSVKVNSQTDSLLPHDYHCKNPFASLGNHSLSIDPDQESPKNDSKGSPLKIAFARQFSTFSQISDLSQTDAPMSSRYSDDYIEISQIGKGHFGKVMKCKNKLDQLEYAVKITKAKFKGEDSMIEALQELYALSSLSMLDDNGQIVKYFTGWIENSKIYVVMELCSESLAKYTEKRKAMTEKDIRKILREIILGLQFLHSNNVVHLDIKPENILLSKRHKYKIGDLGLVRIYNKCADFPEGDCRYLAPELLNSAQIQDLRKADIFSAGVMIYELITSMTINRHTITQKWA